MSIRRHSSISRSSLEYCLPPSPLNIPEEDDDHLISHIYSELDTIPFSTEDRRRQYFSERVILSPRNFDVDKVNEDILERFPGQHKEYLSSDSVIQESGAFDESMPTEYLNTISISGMPLHKTMLKIGCPIILLRNLDYSAGLCNGTRLIIMRMAEQVIEAKILTGSHAGETVFIPRISLDSNQSSTKLHFTLRRRQFPIHLAFAMTFNKSQGQSLNVVGL